MFKQQYPIRYQTPSKQLLQNKQDEQEKYMAFFRNRRAQQANFITAKSQIQKEYLQQVDREKQNKNDYGLD
ncbi:hypothetical protein pb186bvf_004920 [Paramecium bursaria]